MMEDEKMDKMYDYLEPAINELMIRMLVIGNDSAFAATICAMVEEYCEKTGTPLKKMSNAIHHALIHYEEDEQ